MKANSMSRIMLSLILSISQVATGCSAQWISAALADLPVLNHMVLNLAALMSTLQTGNNSVRRRRLLSRTSLPKRAKT